MSRDDNGPRIMKHRIYKFSSPDELKRLGEKYGKDHFRYFPEGEYRGFLYERNVPGSIGGWTSSKSFKNIP